VQYYTLKEHAHEYQQGNKLISHDNAYASSVVKSKVVKSRVGLSVLGSCNLDWCIIIRTHSAGMCIQAIIMEL